MAGESSNRSSGLFAPIIPFIDATHLWIGLGAFALTFETYVWARVEPDMALCLFLGFGSILFYGLHRFFQIKRYRTHHTPRFQFLRKYPFVMYTSMAISAIAMVALTFIFLSGYIFWWVMMGLLSLIYLLPLFKNSTRVRDLPYIKIFVIALAWPSVTLLIPTLLHPDMKFHEIGKPFIERCLFFMLITLPFDIRDRTADRFIGVRTLATQFNDFQLKSMAIGIAILHMIWIQVMNMETHYSICLVVISCLAVLLVLLSNEKRPFWYFSIVLDSLIFLRICLYFGVQYLLKG